jgi:RNA-binding protein
MKRELTGKQRRYLRSLGHHLKPVVHVGHQGLSDALIAKVDDELDAHELIKIKVGESGPEDVKGVGQELAIRLQAHHAQTLGRTVLLYRERDEEPEIRFPR